MGRLCSGRKGSKTAILSAALGYPGDGYLAYGGIAASFLSVLCIVLTELIGPETKAKLVYWRWKHALPGCQAFTKYGPSDPRVDMAKVRRRLGNKLPTDPDDQNRKWYALYKTVRNELGVSDAHKAYLLLRDYTFLAWLFLLFCPAVALKQGASQETIPYYAAALLLQVALVSRSAAVSGRRLVTTVLASIS
ncbi:MAG TPA: hypothetical protein VN723_13050 [Rhizomicrobium sp.]|nr:hypothetical protein [Rhizomicrobium sp.]